MKGAKKHFKEHVFVRLNVEDGVECSISERTLIRWNVGDAKFSTILGCYQSPTLDHGRFCPHFAHLAAVPRKRLAASAWWRVGNNSSTIVRIYMQQLVV